MSENQEPPQDEAALIRTSGSSGLKSTEEPDGAQDAAEAVRRSQQAYLRAMEINWPDGKRKAIAVAVLDVEDALKDYDNLSRGIVAPAYFPDIPAVPEVYIHALQMAAEEVAVRTDALVRALPACATDS